MSVVFRRRISKLPKPKDLSDVVSLYEKIVEAYPNAILQTSAIGNTIDTSKSLTSVSVDTYELGEEVTHGVEDDCTKDATLMMMLTVMMRNICEKKHWPLAKTILVMAAAVLKAESAFPDKCFNEPAPFCGSLVGDDEMGKELFDLIKQCKKGLRKK